MNEFTYFPLKVNDSVVTCENAPQGILNELEALNTTIKYFSQIEDASGIPVSVPLTKSCQKMSQQILKMKDSGNNAFRKQNYPEAKKLYTFALNMLNSRCPWDPSELYREEAGPIFSNLSATCAFLEEYEMAVKYADAAITCRMNYTKAYFRKAKALEALGRLVEAKECLEIGVDFEQPGGDLEKLLQEIKQKLEGVEA